MNTVGLLLGELGTLSPQNAEMQFSHESVIFSQFVWGNNGAWNASKLGSRLDSENVAKRSRKA